MSSDDNSKDDLAARQARNEAIRRARERHNAGTDAPADETADAGSGTGPNYVEFIDRKMREGDKEKK